MVLRGEAVTCGYVCPSEGERFFLVADTDEEVIVLVLDEFIFENGSGCDDSDNFSFDDGFIASFIFGFVDVFCLIADGDLFVMAEESREVIVGGMYGNSAHGYGVSVFVCPSLCEGESEQVSGFFCVFVEEFVEVAHLEEEESGSGFFF